MSTLERSSIALSVNALGEAFAETSRAFQELARAARRWGRARDEMMLREYLRRHGHQPPGSERTKRLRKKREKALAADFAAFLHEQAHAGIPADAWEKKQ